MFFCDKLYNYIEKLIFFFYTNLYKIYKLSIIRNQKIEDIKKHLFIDSINKIKK
jgi:hypothetical protein